MATYLKTSTETPSLDMVTPQDVEIGDGKKGIHVRLTTADSATSLEFYHELEPYEYMYVSEEEGSEGEWVEDPALLEAYLQTLANNWETVNHSPGGAPELTEVS